MVQKLGHSKKYIYIYLYILVYIFDTAKSDYFQAAGPNAMKDEKRN